MKPSTDTEPTHALPADTPAPDFRLRTTPDQEVALSEFRGQPVILAFYPSDWSPVCGDQMGLYNEILPEFQRLGAELLGISVDGVWCHLAFAHDRKLRFPLLSDFEPKGEIARRFLHPTLEIVAFASHLGTSIESVGPIPTRRDTR